MKRILPQLRQFSILLLLLIIFSGGFVQAIRYKQTKVVKPPVQDITQNAVVLLNNQLGSIPFKDLTGRKIASINIGLMYAMQFDNMLRNYLQVKSFTWGMFNPAELASYSTLILEVNPQSLSDPSTLSFIQQAVKSKEVIIAGFGNAAALQYLDSFTNPILWSPEQNAQAAERAAQILLGGERTEGRLKQAISPAFQAGAGYTTWQTRLRYNVSPELVGVDTDKLAKINDIVNEAIHEHATPGAVVMVVKQGNVIFNKSYGYHTYSGDEPTNRNDIFDLASVTKIASTTVAAMRLYERDQLDLNAGIGTYLPDVRSSNKSNIPVRDVLLHQAGFVNLDFTASVKAVDHSTDSSFFYPVKVADKYYLRRNFYQDNMWPKMLRSPLPTRGQYVYSDISMYVMKEIIEHQAAMPLDQYVANEFYAPLGMRTAGYKPLSRFDKTQIVPTEQDNYFRKTVLQGYVQDPGAALADGVSGHAGLFAGANDLAILNQMLLNGGSYGGVDYFKPETITMFTGRQSDVSWRGFGFDRSNGHGYPSKLASTETYGHTGYTGTCVWVDPKYKLIYIFLSNRIYPSASTKLNSLRIRPRIQDVIYSAILDGERDLASVGN